jgi:hypothetical protein
LQRPTKSNGVKRNGARAVRWSFRSVDDVREFWKKFQRVPARRRRSKRDEERYCLALYLLALATYRKLKYPLRIEEGESPDFLIAWSSAKSTGLDVIKATEIWVQREMTNGEARPDWFANVRRAITLASSDQTYRRDLLVYDDIPLPAIDRLKVLPNLSRWLSETRNTYRQLGRLSIIVSLDLLLDSANGMEVLPFINWSDPDAMPDFGERVEFTGKKAVVTALRRHEDQGKPVYFSDGRGHLVKRMPDGTRYEVEVELSGREVVLGELARK